MRKIGDKVMVRTLWDLQSSYYTDDEGTIHTDISPLNFTLPMRKFCGQFVTIAKIYVSIGYRIKEDGGFHIWTDKVFEISIPSYNKQAIFHLKKVIIEGEKMYRILGWEKVLSQAKLPYRYFNKAPYFYCVPDYKTIVIFTEQKEFWSFTEEQITSQDIWNNRIFPALEKAGEKLTRINREREWKGDIVVKI